MKSLQKSIVKINEKQDLKQNVKFMTQQKHKLSTRRKLS
jgi:hypothetical protein